MRARQPLRDVERPTEEQADERVRQAEETAAVQLRATEQRRERGRPAEQTFDRQRDEQDDARRRDRAQRSPPAGGGDERERGERRRRDHERDHGGVGQGRQMPDEQQGQRHERHGDRERCAERSVAAGEVRPPERDDRDQAGESHVDRGGRTDRHRQPFRSDVAVVELERQRSVHDPYRRAIDVGGRIDEHTRGEDHIVVGDHAVTPRRVGRQRVDRTGVRRGPERGGQLRRRPGRHHDRTEAVIRRVGHEEHRLLQRRRSVERCLERVHRGGELVRRDEVPLRYLTQVDGPNAGRQRPGRHERSVRRPGRDHQARPTLLREREEAGGGEQLFERRAVERRDQRLPVVGCLSERVRRRQHNDARHEEQP